MTRKLLAALALLASAALSHAQQATQIQAVAGTRFAVQPGDTSSQFIVQALDSHGAGVANAPITFAVQGTCGSWLGGTATSGRGNSSGYAAAPFTAGPSRGLCPVIAGITGTSITVSAAFRIFTGADLNLSFAPSTTLVTHTNQPFTLGVQAILDGTSLYGAPVIF